MCIYHRCRMHLCLVISEISFCKQEKQKFFVYLRHEEKHIEFSVHVGREMRFLPFGNRLTDNLCLDLLFWH